MKIELEDGTREEVTDIARLAELLRSLDPKTNSFAILSTADHDYVQTALVDGGYLIEKRLGAPDMHFEAAHLVPRPVETAARPWWKFWGEAPKNDCFSLDEVIRTFSAFAGDGDEPSTIKWQKADS